MRIDRIRLYPTLRQQAALRFMLDVTRELYNAALQERRDAYRLRGISIFAKQQYAELTALRKPICWLDTRLAAACAGALNPDATSHTEQIAQRMTLLSALEEAPRPSSRPSTSLTREHHLWNTN